MSEPTVREIVGALLKLREAERREDRATEARQNAVVALAEVVGVKRRDKDTEFEAVHQAERLIIDAAIEAHQQETKHNG